MLLLLLSSVGLVWYTVLWAIGLLGCMNLRQRYRLRPRSPLATAPASSVPGVSILRPLKGLDTNLYENLESTFTQEYPRFEILFCVAEEHDQAIPVVRDLISKYPQVNARLVIGEEIVGVNPKVNNLMKAYRQAAHDILWVIDSNVWVHPGTLARSVDALSPTTRSGRRVGLVHHVPFALATDSGLGSRVEEAFLNTNHAKMYVAINTVAIDSCVVGKSNMYRRSDLELVNGSLISAKASKAPVEQTGLPAFAKFLAEDNFIASALWHELDLRHELSSDVAQNVVGKMTMSDYVWRRVRWIRVRKHMVLAATVVEPLTEGLVLGAIGSTSLFHLFRFPMWISALLHCTLWLGVDLDVYCSLAGHALPSTIRRQFLIGWAIRELLALPIWIIAVLGNTVTWRGRKYRILRNGEVEQVNVGNSLRPWFRVWKRTDYELANDDDC